MSVKQEHIKPEVIGSMIYRYSQFLIRLKDKGRLDEKFLIALTENRLGESSTGTPNLELANLFIETFFSTKNTKVLELLNFYKKGGTKTELTDEDREDLLLAYYVLLRESRELRPLIPTGGPNLLHEFYWLASMVHADLVR